MPQRAILPSEVAELVLRAAARRKKRILAGACALVTLALGLWLGSRWGHITENDAKVMADMITISSRVDGFVAGRNVTDGDPVTQGEAIVVIDQREAVLQVEEHRAKAASLQLESERVSAQLTVTQSTSESAVETAQAQYAGAEANLRSTGAELERTQLDFTRNQRLAAGEIISRQSWDVTRTGAQQVSEKVRQAKAQLAEASAGLANAQAKRGEVAILKKELERLTHDIAQVEAQIGQKEVGVTDRVVRSPISGVVDQKFVEPGEYVIPGQRLLLLHDPKAIWIEVHLKETKLADLRPGQPVTVGVDAYPGRTFTGQVERIGNATTSQFALLPSPNPSGNFTKITQRVPVRIRMEQPDDHPLRPGMMVEVDIDTSHG